MRPLNGVSFRFVEGNGMNLDYLIHDIEMAKREYYQTGRSSYTDEQYDRMVRQAEKLGYVESVGAEPVAGIEVIEHEHPMLSLDKAHFADEILMAFQGQNLVAMQKADGLTVSATYEDGVLTRLETRGNGTKGNDVLFHARSIENLPLTINKQERYVIDGECIILANDFNKINDQLSAQNKFSNPRNLAAGSLNLLDANISKTRHLRFYAWDVIEGGELTLCESLLEATRLGFDTVYYSWLPMTRLFKETIEDAIKEIKHVSTFGGFPIDGVVFKIDDVEYGKKLGGTSHHKNNALAYKFFDESYPTTLKNVTWQVGKTGVITPVLEFEPVQIEGSVVERCTAHNVSIYNSLDITEGCTCYIYKANAIIPECEYTESNGGDPVAVPDVCPACGARANIVQDKDTAVLMCSDPEHCTGVFLARLKHFVSKKGLDIAGLSEKTLEALVKIGAVKEFADIFKLKDWENTLKSIPGFGKRSVENLLNSIEKARNTDLQHFICALSIPGVGESQSKILANTFTTWANFYYCCKSDYDFSILGGFGSVFNDKIHAYAAVHCDIDILAEYFNFSSSINTGIDGMGVELKEQVFVITGKVNHFKNRNEIKDLIIKHGGRVSDTVNKNTTYLINNDITSNSGKNKKAKELGVKIITEDEFLDILGYNVQE